MEDRREHKFLLIFILLTVFARLNAVAFIKVWACPMRRLFKGGVYSKARSFQNHISSIIDNNQGRSIVNTI